MATQIDHKVTISHASGNRYNQIDVAIDSSGHLVNGHGGHSADIIQPFDYYMGNGHLFHFAGQHWDAEGQAMWNNDCQELEPTATPTTATEGTVVEDVVNPNDVHPTATPCPTATATATATATPVPPSDPNVSTCGTVAFTGVPDRWYLVIEPGDMLVTSGFDSIKLAPGIYTYEFRDAKGNDIVGGQFTVEVCSTATPTPFEARAGETATAGGSLSPTSTNGGGPMARPPSSC